MDSGSTEALQPPDWQTARDAVLSGNVGAPCDTASGRGCHGAAVCLDVAETRPSGSCNLATGENCAGICSIAGCVPEDIGTPQTEDDCPPGTVCTRVPVDSGEVGTFCLQRCEPSALENPCASRHKGVACDPNSVLLTDHTEVCLYPACTEDSDCDEKQNEFCVRASGICRSRGTPERRVGDPCASSADCGPHQYCLPEQRSASGLLFEGGYCTLVGCKYGDVFPEPATQYWKCPQGSKCFFMGSGEFISFCLSVECDPDEPEDRDGCRDEASPDQYDCIELGKERACWIDIAAARKKQ